MKERKEKTNEVAGSFSCLKIDCAGDGTCAPIFSLCGSASREIRLGRIPVRLDPDLTNHILYNSRV